MISLSIYREIALSLAGTTEEAHFEKTSFRVNKKIFATYSKANNTASLKLSEIDQEIFSRIDPGMIYPVPNKWGKQGWTIVELNKIARPIFKDVLKAAYLEVMGGKLQLKKVEKNGPVTKKATLRICKNDHQYYKSSDCPTCPVCEKNAKPAEGFLSTLAAPARRALQREGITTLKKLSSYSESELLNLHGIGRTSIPKLKMALQEIGLSFKT